MRILVFGSMALDRINVFPDEFKNHIMPDKLHNLNVSFTVPVQRSSWGGTGGNIAYNLMLLRGEPVLVSAIGKNGGAYLEHLLAMGIGIDRIYRDAELESASCDLTTDLENNQINFYYPGPTDHMCDVSIADVRADVRLAIISASTRNAMLEQIRQCATAKIKIVFDPGQQITTFRIADLNTAISAADFIFGNDYEISLMMDHGDLDKNAVLKEGKTIVTTYGKRGSSVENKSIGRIDIPACKYVRVVDPTGAGDAYRAGFLIGCENGCRMKTCARLGSVAASFAVESLGTQEHRYDAEAFIKRYRENYGRFPRALARAWKSIPAPEA